MMKWMTAGCLAAVCLWSFSGMAQDVIIRKTTASKLTVDLTELRAGGSGGTVFLRTVDEDLRRSGWVVPVRTGAGYSAGGTLAAAGNGLRVPLVIQNSETRQTLFNQNVGIDNADPKRMGHRVSDAILKAVTGRRGMSGCRLVLIGASARGKELFVCDADGGNLSPLTSDGSIVLAPTWGPRGDQILYTSFRRGFADCYLLDLRSGKTHQVAQYSGMNMAGDISPNGQDAALVLSKDGNPELYIKSLSSGALTRMTQTRSVGEASPSWSPDGSQIVYVSDAAGVSSPQLYLISRGGGSRRLTTRGSQNVNPDWGANNLIAYSSRQGGRFALMVYDPALQEHRVIAQDGADYEDPSWAPDGRHIFCTRSEGYRSTIYLLDIMGDPPLKLALPVGNWRSPTCSP
jgi:TolB protein